jgi:hypothetical protein
MSGPGLALSPFLPAPIFLSFAFDGRSRWILDGPNRADEVIE